MLLPFVCQQERKRNEGVLGVLNIYEVMYCYATADAFLAESEFYRRNVILWSNQSLFLSTTDEYRGGVKKLSNEERESHDRTSMSAIERESEREREKEWERTSV